MPQPTRRRHRFLRATAITLGLLIAAALAPTGYAFAASAGRIAALDQLAPRPVAVVFGAATFADGTPSAFLKGRLDVAYDLFRQGIVRVILVSGDNRRANYNEPDAMRTYLINRGVPANKVVADYAGFDTYATCVRAVRIFGVHQAILVSQTYHLPRAIATCRAVGLDAWGAGDDSVRVSPDWTQGWWRELPANAKAAIDVGTGTQPLLGRREDSVTRALAA